MCNTRKWGLVLLMLGTLSLLAACSDGSSSVTDGDEDAEFTAFTCDSDLQCARSSTNMTCHTLRKVCVDHGLCSADDECQSWYGGLYPFCNADGICGDQKTDGDIPSDGDTPNPDGDTPNPDGDTPNPDGDTPNPDGDDDYPWPEDGDLDMDIGDPEIEFDSTPVPCDHNASLGTPAIVVEPNVADFGAVPIGDNKTVELTICNAGGVDLAITGLRFSRETSNEFFKFHADVPITIAPGYAAPVLLMYLPFDSHADRGQLEVLSNDPNNPEVLVDLISAVKATPFIRAIPTTVQFAGALPGQNLTRLLELRNIGLASTTIFELIINGGANSPYSILEVVNTETNQASAAPWVLQPDQALMVTVALKMGDTPVDDTLIVPWITDTGEKQTRVDLVTGDVAMCAVPVAEPDQEVDPLDIVYLDGSRSYDPNGTVLGYKWEWVDKPTDAHRAIILDRNGQNIEGRWVNEPFPNFYAELAGEYLIKLTVEDEEEACTGVNSDLVYIVAKPESTIHIQLMWSASSNDQDLHFIRPGGVHSRENAGNTTDCHYTNCNTQNGTAWPCTMRGCPGPAAAPDWGQLNQRIDDPTLDIDDIGGSGPENINLSLPELGDYKVTVENYSGENSGLVVTVRIFIFGVMEQVFVSQPPHWAQGQHWNVCWIRVHDATNIEIIPIDTIENSQ